MLWEEIVPDKSGLMPPADPKIISDVESQIQVQLPREFVDFLLWADGGQIARKRFIVYSAGQGLHPGETLLAANRNREPNCPLVFIAREAEEEFGFKRSDLPADSAPVYCWLHEEGALEQIAPSFRQFVEWMIRQAEQNS